MCEEEETCIVESPIQPNGWYQLSATTMCLSGCESHDHCSSSPCGPNGICTNTDGGYECECASGYAGRNCTNIDHCLGNSCSSSHSIACLNHPEGTRAVCVCSPGWGGELCDEDIDECLGTPDLCNEGRCVNDPGSYSCSCPPNRSGRNCETLLTCGDMVCMNGGNCSDAGGVVTCNCAAGFTGPFCEDESE